MDNENKELVTVPNEANADASNSSSTNADSDSKPSHNTIMGILSYLGPLVVIPFLVARDEPFVHFHIKQGLVLLIIAILVWVASVMMWMLLPLWQLVNLGVFILAVIGIINVVQGKKKVLPLVGQYADKLKV